MAKPLKLRDFAPETDVLLDEVLEGLQQPAKEIPSKFFYDEYGSRLFDQITTLPEYYPTRTETAIMKKSVDEIASLIGGGAMLIEYGSGSSEKTRILLDHLPDLTAYVPIDISREHLLEAASNIARSYPGLDVMPICADYDGSFEIPLGSKVVVRRVVYYPGSTIGNFHPDEAVKFLERVGRVSGAGGGLLLGVDLKKDPAILHNAYNDSKGVTAEFNLNVLRRINRELEADFQLENFKHRAIYNELAGRIEMHLVSLEDQTVQIDDVEIAFSKGESVWTESSYKYTLREFAHVAEEAGFSVEKVWTDDDDLFSVQYLTLA